MGNIKAVKTDEAPDMNVTAMERAALEGLRDAAMLAQVQYERAQQGVADRNALIFAGIAQRLGLPADAFSVPTHQVNGQTWAVEEVAKPPADDAPTVMTEAVSNAAD